MTWGLRPRVPDFQIRDREGGVYLRRWHVLPRNNWFNVYLHSFLGSDDDRALHDHPYWNLSVILVGSYDEVIPFPNSKYAVKHLRRSWRPWAPWRLVLRRPASSHRIVLREGERKPWTLFVTGPRVREWGFHCPGGWMHHEKFKERGGCEG
jgi:hypothetical protein